MQVSGPLSVAQYMRQALTHPLGGYYMKGNVFGRAGDFTTSPEISQMFGEVLAVWYIAQWQAMGEPDSVKLVELGPGRGTLMSDILRTSSQFEKYWSAVKSVHLVEASPGLREVQAKLLEPYSKEKGKRLMWHDDIDDIPRGMEEEIGKASLVVAHEFFDALPVYQFEVRMFRLMGALTFLNIRKPLKGGEKFLSTLTPIPENFRFVKSPGPTKAVVTMLNDARYDRFKEGEQIEVSPESFTVAEKIGRMIEQDGGAGLIIDYGKNHGIRKHQFTPALSQPGETDLSVDVDFSFISQAVASSGARSHGPMTQGTFLRAMGIVQRMMVLMQSCDGAARKELAQTYERLVGNSATNGMGEVYKVLAIACSTSPPPYPFFENVERTLNDAAIGGKQ
ncbi:NADH dehydrogenase [ubiquinone] complex I, assembly factor 7 [Irineochytrium annulatum]|nr:NADH dehydrogenase [ubiquinone] complex I, assembly factor 7 [Irineochytrium annulatum]